MSSNGSTFVVDPFLDFSDFVDGRSRVLFAVSWVLVEFVGVPISLAVVAYERHESSTYHTVVNQINVALFFTLAAYSLTGFNILALRALWVGPIHPSLCRFQQMEMLTCGLFAVLCVSENTVARYLYLHVLKNIGSVNDNLFSAFLIGVNLVLCVCYWVFLLVTSDHFGGGFYFNFCAGRTMTGYNLGSSLGGSGSVLKWSSFLSIAIYFLLKAVNWYKAKGSPGQLPLASQPQQDSTLFGILFGRFSLSAVIILLALSQAWVNVVNPKLVRGADDVSSLQVASALMFSQVVVLFLMPCTIYARHRRLRRYIGRMAKEWARAAAFPLSVVVRVACRLFGKGGTAQVAPLPPAEEMEMHELHM